ncbi:glycerophosphoryl diester phosphodiesterase membrane domain-containing protein [Fischerella thermalis]|jgi:hypothetical protein|uniref:Glycerophosphoryl diester phosphodiesterase membrane domain-containing protein n=1 Tax=Fischerella thermalis JSC-11 TaxID=741277 RepID=G6FRW8_9CYAN|nr:glycerophosphoryl diester phosphodiesterase membrane domain-containing protein [Fischerella thermalis]PMB01144.1 DUF975 domain-containing protein [Fischerella thermalis CCMEE 5328]PMB08036.1 DUF975 domain-containing protein [Fischerella thermalis CCMEE 5273]RDH48831.1 DUF975 domain-containing protein [Mastigocladus laminosus WC112]EHC16192.1 hypothetical protein FJSC11DRAFT_1615 [Fischerella thermalis JSC-11]PLZ12923.1 DUF975 domain-containing protein [Fischerella thermalis WC114]
MSYNLGSPSPIEPLSLGNVITAGIRIYRSHLKDYFLLALKAYVWLLVPIYGWAKFYALSALISRLTFAELVNQPESISSGQRFVNSRIWQFLINILLMLLVGTGILIGVVIVFAIFGFLSAVLVGGLNQQANIGVYLMLGLLAFVVGILALVAVLWISTRFYLVEVPLAIEDNVDGTSTIARSWELTKGYVWRIILISFVAFLITLPIQIVVQIVSTIVQLVFTPLLEQNSGFGLLFAVIILALSFASGAVVLPFWQAIKAVIYYDLRSRKEGLGLKLRDYEI